MLHTALAGCLLGAALLIPTQAASYPVELIGDANPLEESYSLAPRWLAAAGDSAWFVGAMPDYGAEVFSLRDGVYTEHRVQPGPDGVPITAMLPVERGVLFLVAEREGAAPREAWGVVEGQRVPLRLKAREDYAGWGGECRIGSDGRRGHIVCSHGNGPESWHATDGTPEGTVLLHRSETRLLDGVDAFAGSGDALWVLMREAGKCSLWRAAIGEPRRRVTWFDYPNCQDYHVLARSAQEAVVSVNTFEGGEVWRVRADAEPDVEPAAERIQAGPDVGGAYVIGDRLAWFSEAPQARLDLWSSDGTAAGTVRSATGLQLSGSVYSSSRLLAVNVVDAPTQRRQVLLIDGTAAGTRILPGTAYDGVDHGRILCLVDGYLLHYIEPFSDELGFHGRIRLFDLATGQARVLQAPDGRFLTAVSDEHGCQRVGNRLVFSGEVTPYEPGESATIHSVDLATGTVDRHVQFRDTQDTGIHPEQLNLGMPVYGIAAAGARYDTRYATQLLRIDAHGRSVSRLDLGALGIASGGRLIADGDRFLMTLQGDQVWGSDAGLAGAAPLREDCRHTALWLAPRPAPSMFVCDGLWAEPTRWFSTALTPATTQQQPTLTDLPQPMFAAPEAGRPLLLGTPGLVGFDPLLAPELLSAEPRRSSGAYDPWIPTARTPAATVLQGETLWFLRDDGTLQAMSPRIAASGRPWSLIAKTLRPTTHGRAVFMASTPHRNALWVTDGTDAGTRELFPAGSTLGNCSSFEPTIDRFVVAGERVYLPCRQLAEQRDLIVIDASGAVPPVLIDLPDSNRGLNLLLGMDDGLAYGSLSIPGEGAELYEFSVERGGRKLTDTVAGHGGRIAGPMWWQPPYLVFLADLPGVGFEPVRWNRDGLFRDGVEGPD